MFGIVINPGLSINPKQNQGIDVNLMLHRRLETACIEN